MDRNIFLRNKGKVVTIIVKPKLKLTGEILEVFDDCFEFRTKEKDSTLEFEMVGGIIEVRNDE